MDVGQVEEDRASFWNPAPNNLCSIVIWKVLWHAQNFHSMAWQNSGCGGVLHCLPGQDFLGHFIQSVLHRRAENSLSWRAIKLVNDGCSCSFISLVVVLDLARVPDSTLTVCKIRLSAA